MEAGGAERAALATWDLVVIAAYFIIVLAVGLAVPLVFIVLKFFVLFLLVEVFAIESRQRHRVLLGRQKYELDTGECGYTEASSYASRIILCLRSALRCLQVTLAAVISSV